MKHLLPIALTVLLLACCTTPGEYRAMSHGLDSINGLNRSDRPFSPADVQPYVSYFDRHGSGNDRLLAHYLLGRAYHEQGEAPMALQCYQEALAAADTTAADCDYAQLSRVYGQMAVIYGQQNLVNRQMNMFNNASKYSLLAKDTLTAVIYYEHRSDAYENMGLVDSVLAVIDSTAKWFERHHLRQDVAITYGRAIPNLIIKGQLDKARKYMSIYESESGYFDEYGNIEKGREGYYESKGMLLLKECKYDSAEYWFRKELHDAKDISNQNMGAMGLALLYEKTNQGDSAAKYAIYSYKMNDSLYLQTAINEVERMSALYNYTHNQEIAMNALKSESKTKVRLLTSILILLCVCLIAVWLSIARKKAIESLEKMSKELADAQIVKTELEHDKTGNRLIIIENEKRIRQLEKKLGRYGKLIYFGPRKAENDLKISSNYQFIKTTVSHGQKFTEKEWDIAENLVNEYFPECYDFLVSKVEVCTLKFKICLLLRLHFISKEVGCALGYTPAYVTKLSTEVFQELYGKIGGSKELGIELRKIY